MKKYYVLHFLCISMAMVRGIDARAVPGNSQEVVGVNVGGLHADIKTNLFAPDGPLAQLGNEITSGADQLQKELTSGAEALQSDLKKAENFMAQGSQEKIAGVNVGGLHADLKTNLFSNTGPLAQIGNDLAQGELQLQNDLAKGASALEASLTNAADALQAQLASAADFLTNGLQNLGQQITSATGEGSLDDLLKGTNDLFSMGNKETDSDPQEEVEETNSLQKSGKTEIKPQNRASRTLIKVNPTEPEQDSEKDKGAKTSNALLSILQGGNSVQTDGGRTVTKTVTITGQTSGSNPMDLSDLFKNIQLPNLFDNSKGA